MQILYWIFFYVNVAALSHSSFSKKSSTTPVSIVVCAKNEDLNIKQNFSSWTTQLTHQDELIIVDDFSADHTLDTLKSISADVSNCKVVVASKDRPGKKQAMTDGIQASTKDYILLTDADCSPNPSWKNFMVGHLQPHTEFVLGYAPFYKEKGFLNLFQRFECLLTALQYFSYALAGLPYMGVGRNMLFKKSIFDEEIYHAPIASGDDDLLVSAKATKENTVVCVESESFVFSKAKPTLKSYLSQKMRHISSSTEYKPLIKFLLSAFAATQLCSNVLLLVLLFTTYWKLAVLIHIVKSLFATLTLRKASALLQEGSIFIFTAILDLTLTFYYVILMLCYPFKKKTTWN